MPGSPAGFASALARADAGSRSALVERLQAAGGNASVQRLLENAGGTGDERTRVVTYPFSVAIRKPSSAAHAPGRADAPIGEEHGEQEKQAAFAQAQEPESAGAAAEPSSPAQDGAPGEAGPQGEGGAEAAEGTAPPGQEAPAGGGGKGAQVPDIHLPELDEISRCDSLGGQFLYNSSIARGGAQPSGFGVTRSFGSSLTNVWIFNVFGTFYVAARFNHPITYQVRSGTGPAGEVDIPSANAGAITAANYATVAADLTPNMSDLNGRPPRTGFWAEDLTLRHERVHADDDHGNGPAAMETARTWLNGQTASTESDVNTLLGAVPGRFASALLAALSTEDGEKHAYGDGAPSYTTRASAITAKGGRGEYA